ncbi:MAG TPA: hypothetical protein VGO47_06940 [Chlamydiales bacterium]|jgi:hypothetical protein|nr:hypothetical protein [Chlamydiales bacterium]
MAFVSQGWKLVLTFLDSGANQTTRTFDLTATDDAGDLAPVIADVATIVSAWVAATDAVLISEQVTKVTVEDSVVLPAAGVQVENNAQISAKIDGIPNKSAVFEVPAPKITMFAATTGPGSNVVQFTTTPVPALVNIFKDGGQAFISDGESITDQGIKGKRVHHKSTRG